MAVMPRVRHKYRPTATAATFALYKSNPTIQCHILLHIRGLQFREGSIRGYPNSLQIDGLARQVDSQKMSSLASRLPLPAQSWKPPMIYLMISGVFYVLLCQNRGKRCKTVNFSLNCGSWAKRFGDTLKSHFRLHLGGWEAIPWD